MKLVHWLAIALGATTSALAFTVGLLIGGARDSDSGAKSPRTFWCEALAESSLVNAPILAERAGC